MKPHRFLLTLVGLGLLMSVLACGGSSRVSAPPVTAAPYATTVGTLITQKTTDSGTPDTLESLDLKGADTEDPHAFDTVLGIK